MQGAWPLGFRELLEFIGFFLLFGLVDASMSFCSFSSSLGFFFDLHLLVNQIKDSFGCEGYDRPSYSKC